MALSTPAAHATIQTFRGRAPITYGSSIPGINKHDVFYFSLSIDDSVLDVENYDRPNDMGGVTALGEFKQAIVDFAMYAYPGNTGSLDPSTITYRPGKITSIDGTPSSVGLDYLEKLSLSIPVSDASLAAGAPFSHVYINLYNGTLYTNPSSRQLLLDESSGFPTTFADIFIHGPQTMAEFLGERDANAEALVDGIFLEGRVGSGTLASGQGVTLEYVPPQAVPGPASGLGLLAGWRMARRLRRRLGAEAAAPRSGAVRWARGSSPGPAGGDAPEQDRCARPLSRC